MHRTGEHAARVCHHAAVLLAPTTGLQLALIGLAAVGVSSTVVLAVRQRRRAARDAAQRRALVAAAERTLEHERRRLSLELHDELGQSLTAVFLMLQRAARLDDDAARRQVIQETLPHCQTVVDQVRSLSSRLRAPAVEERSFVDAVEGVVGDFERSAGVRVEPALDLAEGTPATEKLSVTRLAQEALEAVSRGTAAELVRLELSAGPGRLELVLEDERAGPLPGGNALAHEILHDHAALLGAKHTLENTGTTGMRLTLRRTTG